MRPRRRAILPRLLLVLLAGPIVLGFARRAAGQYAAMSKQELERIRRFNAEVRQHRAEEDRKWAEVRARSICLANAEREQGLLAKAHEGFRRQADEAARGLFLTPHTLVTGVKALAANRVDALVVRANEFHWDRQELSARLAEAFPADAPQIVKRPWYRIGMMILVNARNPVRTLTLEQVEKLFRGETQDWSALGGPRWPVQRYGTAVGTPSEFIFSTKLLKGRRVTFEEEKSPEAEKLSEDDRMELLASLESRHPGHGAFPRYLRNDQVIAAVGGGAGAIGYCVIPGPPVKLTDVRPLYIRFPEAGKPASSQPGSAAPGPPVAPTAENVLSGRYDLYEDVSFLVHPEACDEAKRFIQHACSPAAAGLFRGTSLIPHAARDLVLMERRLAALRAGEGVPIPAVGTAEAEKLVPELGLQYVKAKALVQVRYYGVADDLSAVGYFVATGEKRRDLLVLAQPPGRDAMASHGAKWRALRPQVRVLGARAVAIVAHSMNEVNKLTIEQLRQVFVGGIMGWRDALPAGDREAKDPLPAEPHNRNILRYGLGLPHPAAELFYRKVLASAHEAGLIERKKDTAGVLAAVAINPNAVGFVDYAELPADVEKMGVKLLAVAPGGGVAVRLSRTAILDGSYPLSERLLLYVSPKAGAAAQELLGFIFGGHAEAGFRKHGFLGPPRAASSRPAPPLPVGPPTGDRDVSDR